MPAMFAYARIIVACSLVVSLTVGLETIPDYLHVCKGNDPDVVNCTLRSVNFLRPYLANGIPELKVPSLEPLELGDLLVSQKTTGRTGLRITARDIKAYNASQFEVRNLKIESFGQVYTFDVAFKSLYVTGVYELDGQILLLPITGSGTFSSHYKNSYGKNRVTFDRMERDGQQYVHIKKVETDITVQSGSINLKNLFNGDKLLGDTINETINQNFNAISDDIIPLVERALNKVFKKIANRICNRYTFEQLFPQS